MPHAILNRVTALVWLWRGAYDAGMDLPTEGEQPCVTSFLRAQ